MTSTSLPCTSDKANKQSLPPVKESAAFFFSSSFGSISMRMLRGWCWAMMGGG